HLLRLLDALAQVLAPLLPGLGVEQVRGCGAKADCREQAKDAESHHPREQQPRSQYQPAPYQSSVKLGAMAEAATQKDRRGALVRAAYNQIAEHGFEG